MTATNIALAALVITSVAIIVRSIPALIVTMQGLRQLGQYLTETK